MPQLKYANMFYYCSHIADCRDPQVGDLFVQLLIQCIQSHPCINLKGNESNSFDSQQIKLQYVRNTFHISVQIKADCPRPD